MTAMSRAFRGGPQGCTDVLAKMQRVFNPSRGNGVSRIEARTVETDQGDAST